MNKSMLFLLALGYLGQLATILILARQLNSERKERSAILRTHQQLALRTRYVQMANESELLPDNYWEQVMNDQAATSSTVSEVEGQ